MSREKKPNTAQDYEFSINEKTWSLHFTGQICKNSPKIRSIPSFSPVVNIKFRDTSSTRKICLAEANFALAFNSEKIKQGFPFQPTKYLAVYFGNQM